MAELKARGATILYVTHRLPEVFKIADRVTVLREGKRVATQPVIDLDSEQLIEMILGYRLEPAVQNEREAAGSALLEVANLCGGRVGELDLALRAGEIVGITGLVGSGYEHVLSLIFGAQRAQHGVINVEGTQLPLGDPGASVAAGLGFVPADRRGLGAVAQWSLRENITLSKIPHVGFVRWLSTRREPMRRACGWIGWRSCHPIRSRLSWR